MTWWSGPSIAERTTEAFTEFRSQGRSRNHAPIGWDIADGHLEAHPVEQETLARARELRGSGLGYLKIAEVLNNEKRPTKRGAPWQSMSVRSVLRSAEKGVLA